MFQMRTSSIWPSKKLELVKSGLMPRKFCVSFFTTDRRRFGLLPAGLPFKSRVAPLVVNTHAMCTHWPAVMASGATMFCPIHGLGATCSSAIRSI